MKNVQLKLFLAALLTCNVTSPVEYTEQKQAAAIITGLVAVGGVYNYIRYTYFDRPEEFYVKHSFPYAQMWYDEMTIKYPAAHLDTKRFLQADYGIPKEDAVWSALYNSIHCPQADLAYIDAMYKKKMNGEPWTDDEIMTSNAIEWLLLHEAGHVELNYSLNDLYLGIGLYATFETMKMLYTESTDEASKKAVEKALSGYISHDRTHQFLTSSAMWMRYVAMTFPELFAMGCIKLAWVRDQEAQADNFANTHAAMDALPGGIGFFQRLIDWYKDTIEATKNELEQDPTSLSFLSYFNMTADEFARKVIYFGNDYLHPNPESRVQAIRDEIERRLKDQVVSQ